MKILSNSPRRDLGLRERCLRDQKTQQTLNMGKTVETRNKQNKKEVKKQGKVTELQTLKGRFS